MIKIFFFFTVTITHNYIYSKSHRILLTICCCFQNFGKTCATVKVIVT